MIIKDADRKPIHLVRSTTRFGEKTTGYFVTTNPETDKLRISSEDYFDLRGLILNCGSGAKVFSSYLNQTDNQEARTLLSLGSNINPEEFSDSSIQYLKRYLPIASLREYIDRYGEQTVFLQDAAKAGKRDVIAVDSLLYLWLTDEKQNFPQAPMDLERKLMSHILAGFEKGSPQDEDWSSTNYTAVRYFTTHIRDLRRNYTGRYEVTDSDPENLLHNILQIPIPNNLTNPWYE